MWQEEETPTEFQFEQNPYDSFMRRHLQHYGYYTGRNQGYKNSFQTYAEWEKNYPFMSESDSSECSDSDSDDKKDNKLQEELLKTTQLVYINHEGKGMVPRLREPRNLYAVAKELGPQQAARWPSDIQVIDRRIKHIEYIPQDPEPFYRITGLEKSPMVRGEERGGRLVFMYEPRSTFFVRSRVGGIRTGPEQCAVSIDRSVNDTTLIFESRFESGNLAKAIQVGEYEYELWLRYDLYTSKHTQWFYFSVSNTRPNVNYRFSIVNFMKPDSLYNYGMKPLMYSEKDALQKKVGWRRSGLTVKYYRNNIKYETSRGERPFYSLTWTTDFPHKGDTVYFSHCYPYTYTDLQDYLLELANDPIKSKICKQRVLCRTLAGNLVYVLTITSPSQNPEDIKHKKAVVVTARVHPGESNSSWMMKGFLDYLTSNSADSKLLRDTFIFKIVPMLNPDGVIVGNYRCSLAGRDLNRNYKTVLKDAYPTVWHTKQMIRRLLQEREIVAYCDLHGHSRRQNVFIYGCENRHNPQRRLRERIFPCMLNKNSPDMFNYDSCKFKVQKSKEGTGRIVMWNMGIVNSYTMEATFCGSTMGKKKGLHFSARDFEEMGYDFCDTLLDYCDPDATKCTNVLFNLEDNLRQEIRIKLESKGINADTVDLNDDLSAYDLESSDGGSDSSVSDGPPVHLQFQPNRVPKKKKKLKTKKERDRVRDSGKVEGGKKLGDKEKSTDDSGQRKPLSGHQTAHAKQEKQRKLLETAKCEAEDTQALANDYLEALTHAYLRKGILQNQAEQAPAHLRYSGTAAKPPSMPFSMEGLCPHHEQAFAAQLMAQQLQNMTGVVGNSFVRVWKDYLQKHRSPPKLQRVHPPVNGSIRSGNLSWRELNMDEFIRNNIPSPQGHLSERRPSNRHILEVSESQRRQLEMQQSRKPEKSASRSNLVEDKDKMAGLSSRLRAQIPSATFVNYETFKISQMNIDNGENKPDEMEKGKSEDGNEKDVVEDTSKKEGHHKGHKHSGRKSRMGMHDSEEEEFVGKVEGPDYVQDPHSHKPPRVKSAKAGGEEINSAIQSIRDLRQSLASSAANSNLSPTAGNYIKKLLKHELRKTDEDIDDITTRLQHNIDEKQKHVSYDGMLKRQGSAQHVSADKPVTPQKNTASKSAPVSSAKQSERLTPIEKPVERTDRSDKSDIHNSASTKQKKDSVMQKIHTRSLTNINGNASVVANNKLVDAYHIPDTHTLSQGNKQDGFRGTKLQTEAGELTLLKQKNSKLESLSNGRLESISTTDLTQINSGGGSTARSTSIGPVQKKKFYNGGSGNMSVPLPRSASSSSSRDESSAELKSGSSDKLVEKNESAQRARSAKNASRTVVGKRYYGKPKYPKRHYPAVSMLKIEGSTCTPSSLHVGVASSPSPTPRSITSTSQINPLIGSTRPFGTSRHVINTKPPGGGV